MSRRVASPLVAAAFAALACAATGPWAARANAEERELRLAATHRIAVSPPNALTRSAPALSLRLHVALIRGGGWSLERASEPYDAVAAILAQCGIALRDVEISEFEGPARYRMLWTPVSRDFARQAKLPRPTLFFVADTLHRPAFDAEAVGLGNSRSRPEMAHTVWITAAVRDLPVVIAHELVHVLANSGEHSDAPGNLMREESAPQSTRLSAEQCRAIAVNGQANGLLNSETSDAGRAESGEESGVR